jgi:hypothetical protein
MAAADIYRKTDRGQAEIAARKLKLNPRLRTMLILIDGTQPELLVKEEGAKVGAPADFLDQLLTLGLVEKAGRAAFPEPAANDSQLGTEPDEFQRFRAAKDFMNVTIVNALGLKSFFFTLKLERAGMLADLRHLAEAYHEAIAKADGEAAAEVLSRRLKDMLR